MLNTAAERQGCDVTASSNSGLFCTAWLIEASDICTSAPMGMGGASNDLDGASGGVGTKGGSGSSEGNGTGGDHSSAWVEDCRKGIDCPPPIAGCVDVLLAGVESLTTSGDIAGFPGENAKDGDLSTEWHSATGTSPAWMDFEFSEAHAIRQYSIVSANDSSTTQAPMDFKLYASNEGILWLELDSRELETNWQPGEQRFYQVDSPLEHTMYELHFTDDNDPDQGLKTLSHSEVTLEICD